MPSARESYGMLAYKNPVVQVFSKLNSVTSNTHLGILNRL